MNNFEFQKLMNVKKEEEEEKITREKPVIYDNDITIDNKNKDPKESLTIEEINEQRAFKNQLNNINIKQQNK